MQPKKPKNQAKQYIDQNPIEAIRDIGRGVVQSAAADLGRGAVNNLWEQLLGGDLEKQNKESSGELLEGEELDLAALYPDRKEEAKAYVEPGIDYRREIIHAEKRAAEQGERHVTIRIEEIIVELKKLVDSSKELKLQFREVTVEQAPVEAGKYHVSFFEWLLSVVKIARMKVEDASSWLSLFNSKKRQKGYWQMFKKHGTTFGLSNERVVATQVG